MAAHLTMQDREVISQMHYAGHGPTAIGRALGRSPSSISRELRRNERGIWQRRYWEHTIRDELDFDRHFDYIHWNPVKHEHTTSPRDWPWSSFHRWVQAGVYDQDWGCLSRGRLDFSDLDETAMELCCD